MEKTNEINFVSSIIEKHLRYVDPTNFNEDAFKDSCVATINFIESFSEQPKGTLDAERILVRNATIVPVKNISKEQLKSFLEKPEKTFVAESKKTFTPERHAEVVKQLDALALELKNNQVNIILAVDKPNDGLLILQNTQKPFFNFVFGKMNHAR